MTAESSPVGDDTSLDLDESEDADGPDRTASGSAPPEPDGESDEGPEPDVTPAGRTGVELVVQTDAFAPPDLYSQPERTKYQQIAERLRGLIRRGDLKPGSAMPTENDLVKQHKVSRNTVRLALAALTNEGLITGGRGRGRVVRRREPLVYYATRIGTPEPEEADASPTDLFLHQVRAQRRDARQEIQVALVTAKERVAAALRIDEGDTVVVRRRLQIVDDHPWSSSDSYYPLPLVQSTAVMSPNPVAGGIFELLAEMGYRQTRYVDELTVRMPDPDEASRLSIGPGVPVLASARVGLAGDKPVRLTDSVFPGDRHRIVYDLPVS